MTRALRPSRDGGVSMIPAVALGLAGFLANFDVTSVIVALPLIARELGLGSAGFAWVMDAYSLAFTGTLLVAGALADRHGRRKALLAGNVVFAIASVACGLAWDGLSLILARALQGMGSAFIITGGFALVASAYADPAARARAFSWLGVITGVAMALGPTVGGLVAVHAGWRWIFFANLPACLLIAWWVPRLVMEYREPHPRPLDYLGMALFTSALCVLVEALLHGQGSVFRLLVGLALAGALMVMFVLQQRRRTSPVFDPAVFFQRPMAGVAILLAAVSVGYWSVLVFLPPLLAVAYGWPADVAGLAMLAATLPMLVVPLVGSKLVDRLGWQHYFGLALIVLTLGNTGCLFIFATGDLQQPPIALIVAMTALGTGAALAHPQLSGAVVALAPASQAGLSSAMTVVLRQGWFAVGIAVLGTSIASPEQASGYATLFSIAAIACALGAMGSFMCLPPKTKAMGPDA